jgi:hypothetical protein
VQNIFALLFFFSSLLPHSEVVLFCIPLLLLSLEGRGGAGFPVTLHRSCLRLCACPVLAAGDGLCVVLACGS